MSRIKDLQKQVHRVLEKMIKRSHLVHLTILSSEPK